MKTRRSRFLWIAVVLLCCTAIGLSGRNYSSAQGIRSNAAPATPRPGVYIARDSANLDPSQWPIVGGHMTFSWKQLEPSEGQYRWDLIENFLAAQWAKGKPAALHLQTYAGQAGGLMVPSWFQSRYPDAVLTCGTEQIPKYWHWAYLQKYANFVRALGQRFDGDPRRDSRHAAVPAHLRAQGVDRLRGAHLRHRRLPRGHAGRRRFAVHPRQARV
jgi:hypothetical protein